MRKLPLPGGLSYQVAEADAAQAGRMRVVLSLDLRDDPGQIIKEISNKDNHFPLCALPHG